MTTSEYNKIARAGVSDGEMPSAPLFSVVTLVATKQNYDRMRASFAQHGFDATGTQYIAIDNTSGNAVDGYGALYSVVDRITGRYVVLTHDDVELVSDGFDTLKALVEDLEDADPHWMIAGNAGATDTLRLARHIDDPVLSERIGPQPVRVVSLDENFLVMPRTRLPFPSLELGGFHLFATDMCLQARARGGSAYVVPFLLHHHSSGAVDATYHAAAAAIESFWSARGVSGVVRTPSTFLFFGRKGTLLRPIVAAARLTRRGLRALSATFRTMLLSRRIPFETREQF